ncbi:MAG: 16S rRNA (uracil(1498)-N(3))-methyltransferase [Alphaproteobacteria bacterium]|nr:16S rRNA (uracil(1498)-N(3))-methyltransferase [Alphaproteobacteria bacterium]
MYNLLKRVYTEDQISVSSDVLFCNTDKIHHITKVLRLKEEDEFLLFNEESGEFLVNIKEVISKSKILLSIKKQVRTLEKSHNINVAFSPIKQERLRFLIEKCTEIGCTSFHPVITERSIVRKITVDKLRSYAISASEQSGRIDVPNLFPAQSLLSWLSNCDNKILFCDECEEKNVISKIDHQGKVTVLIGPEGGFTEKERELILKNKNVTSVSLGKNILRAETASIFAVIAMILR